MIQFFNSHYRLFHKFVSVDVSMIPFTTLSTGESILSPHFFRQDEKTLAKV